MARLVGDGAAQGKPRAALVLRVENSDMLRASLGPALLDRMMDVIALRLTADLRFLPQSRYPGQTELMGVLADCRPGSLPGHLAQLGKICRSSIELGDLRITPVINAAMVRDNDGADDLTGLYAYARDTLAACSPLTPAGQIRFVEYPGPAGQAVAPAAPLFSPEQIRVLFQPQICCDTGQIAALQVSARLDHPDLGAMDLADVQARLDPEALAASIRSVLRSALGALRGWDLQGSRVPFISYPLGDHELADPTLADTILWELDRLDLQPERLEIEITEPIGRHAGRVPVTANLQRLAGAGCRIAMGDFGTGSAGLDDVRAFGIRRVRIGRSFVAACDRRADQQRMILAILALAEHLKLETLADGVAATEEKSFLSQIGFNAVQGSAVAASMTAAQTDDFLSVHDQFLPQPFALRRKA